MSGDMINEPGYESLLVGPSSSWHHIFQGDRSLSSLVGTAHSQPALGSANNVTFAALCAGAVGPVPWKEWMFCSASYLEGSSAKTLQV